MKQIPLTRGLFALVSSKDYAWLSSFTWRAIKVPKSRTWYAMTLNSTLMHRLILRPHENSQVDHINGNGLDNRRENLREVTPGLNSQNAQLSLANTTGVKGVSFEVSTGKYRATVNYNYKQYNAGRFLTLQEAEAAVRELRTRLHKNANHG